MLNLFLSKLSGKQKTLLLHKLRTLQALPYRGNLTKLAAIHKTDKWNSHWYIQHYEKHFHSLRNKKIKLLEIGVGGYTSPYNGGNSLRMWRDYFVNGKIFSIDIYDKSALNKKRIKIFKGSQDDEAFLIDISNKYGPFDIIIDDGSHVNKHVLTSFKCLFPLLNDKGIYVIEDTQTSYFEDYGGDKRNLNNENTIMGFLKSLIDGLNHQEYKNEASRTYYDKKIFSMHFYHNIVFIEKKNNDELSNYKSLRIEQ